jgi:hemerythrin-like domain-containing protein
MPVQIGAPVHGFSDPTGLLSDCHRRIEMFLATLEAVARAGGAPLREDAARSLAAALRYFREAAPKHNADEEESLFPRMRRAGGTEAAAALTRLAALEEEHRWAEPLHAEADRLGRRYLAEGRLTEDEAEALRDAVGRLAAMYREHIRVEDEVVFPAAARVLSAADRAAMAGEMAARRETGDGIRSA